jgi:hypothetical protein
MRARGGGLTPASLGIAPTGLCLPSTFRGLTPGANIFRPCGAHAIAQSPKV